VATTPGVAGGTREAEVAGTASAVGGCDLLVQSELDRRCRGFTHLAPPRPARILLRPGSQAAHATTHELTDALVAEVSSIGRAFPSGSIPCHSELQAPCLARDEPQTLNLLVWVGTSSHPEPAEEQAVGEWLDQRPDALAVAVLPPDADPDVATPLRLRHLHAIRSGPRSRQAALEVLALAGVDAAERRVFVSYSHADGIELAHAVVQALMPARFEVFLDSFTLTPGVDFGERIEHELLGKAFLVLIETPGAIASDWVDRELAFARRNRLGIASVWRGPPDPRLEGIGAKRRWLLPKGALLKSGGGPSLRESAATDLRDFVSRHHALTIAHRRRVIDEDLRKALHRVGLGSGAVRPMPGGLEVETRSGRYDISLRPRPAELLDMHEADLRTGSGNAGVMVSATPRGTREREALAWLSRRTGIVHWDEGKLRALAQRLVE
jgi:TIR domain-containing protein